MFFITKKLNKGILDKALFWCLVLSIPVMFSSYIYFIQGSITKTVNVEVFEKNISQVSSEISRLETGYLGTKSGLNIDLALTSGFVEDFNKVNFANAGTGESRGRLTFLNNEI